MKQAPPPQVENYRLQSERKGYKSGHASETRVPKMVKTYEITLSFPHT